MKRIILIVCVILLQHATFGYSQTNQESLFKACDSFAMEPPIIKKVTALVSGEKFSDNVLIIKHQ